MLSTFGSGATEAPLKLPLLIWSNGYTSYREAPGVSLVPRPTMAQGHSFHL